MQCLTFKEPRKIYLSHTRIHAAASGNTRAIYTCASSQRARGWMRKSARELAKLRAPEFPEAHQQPCIYVCVGACHHPRAYIRVYVYITVCSRDARAYAAAAAVAALLFPIIGPRYHPSLLRIARRVYIRRFLRGRREI